MNLFLAAAVHLYVLVRLLGKFVAITLMLPVLLAKRGMDLPMLPFLVSTIGAIGGLICSPLLLAAIWDVNHGNVVPAWAWWLGIGGVYLCGPCVITFTVQAWRAFSSWIKDVYAAELLEVRKAPKPHNCACDG